MTATQAPTLDELLTEFETATAKRGPTLEELFPPPSGPDESELRRRVQEAQAMREQFTALQQAEARDEEERARRLAEAEERARMAKETRDVVTLAVAAARNVSTQPVLNNGPSPREMMRMSERQWSQFLESQYEHG